MKLYFLRHGSAEERTEGRSDFDRTLTPEGIAEARRVGVGLRRLVPEFDLLITSPLARALETAKLVEKEILVRGGPHQVSNRLASGAFDLIALRELVRIAHRDSRVLLVGHEPDFSEVVEELTGARIELKKAGLALVETGPVGPGSGLLRWLLVPKHMELAGAAGPEAS